jgi:hypothetical protein
VLARTRHIHYEPADTLSPQHQDILHHLLTAEPDYQMYSEDLGWSVKANGASSLYQANAMGIRADREYALSSPTERLRIVSFGDSFTHGDDVLNRSTWEVDLEALDPQLELLNFGVSGYGLDQAYLRYLQDGAPFQADVVFIGFMSENIYRNVNRYRPFYYKDTTLPLAKPRFTVEDGELALLPNPLPTLADYDVLLSQPQQTLAQLGQDDYYFSSHYKTGWFDFSPTVRFLKIAANEVRRGELIVEDGYYNEGSEAFQVTTAIFDAFYETAVHNNSLPIILVFPSRDDIERHQQEGTSQYAPLLAYFDDQDYLYLDIQGAFDEVEPQANLDDIVNAHYSPDGNQLVAEYLAAYLATQGFEAAGDTTEMLRYYQCVFDPTCK